MAAFRLAKSLSRTDVSQYANFEGKVHIHFEYKTAFHKKTAKLLIAAFSTLKYFPGYILCSCTMERWRQRVALVTGAFGGIGSAITRKLVNEGMVVVGCGRNMDAAEKLAAELKDKAGSFISMKCDLLKEDEILAMFEVIKRDHGGVDVCINNAGVNHSEPLLTGNTDAWNEIWQVNVQALLICTRESFKSMTERSVDDGHIFFINSMSGQRVLSNKNTHFYAATKFAVTAIREGVRNELRELKSHIRSTSISPGVVWTNMVEKDLKTKENIEAFRSKMPEPLTADDVADAVLYALQAAPHVQVHEVMLRPTDQAM